MLMGQGILGGIMFRKRYVKIIMLVVALVLFFGCLQKVVVKVTQAHSEDKRTIKTKTIYSPGTGKIVVHYDEQEREIEYRYYNEDDKLIVLTTEYDESGDIRERNQYEGNEKKLVWKELTTREELEGCVRLVVTSYDGDGSMTHQRIDNENGDMLSNTNYDSDGTIIIQCINQYDEAGNLILMEKITETETIVIAKYSHIYDETGRLVETVELYDNGDVMIRERYDKNSNLTECIRYGEDGKEIYHNRYTYDKKGNCLSEIGADGSHITYKYNKKEELLEKKSVYSNGETKKIIYLVSREGNTETKETITYIGERKVGHNKEITQYHDNGNKYIYQLIDNDEILTYEEYNTDGDVILRREILYGEEEYEWEYSYQYWYQE